MKSCTAAEYYSVFTAKNGRDYGVRPAIKKDAPGLVPIFIDEYDHDYLYPWVYDPEAFERQIESDNQYWFVAEDIARAEPCATAVAHMRPPYSLLAGKLTSKKCSRGIGLLTNLGLVAFTALLTSSELRGVLRFDNDIRATNISSQRFAEQLNCIGYGFIPNYNNYADKRGCDLTASEPFSAGRIEPVVMSVAPLRSFWNIRRRDVFLYDDPNIVYFYSRLTNVTDKMKDDNVTLSMSSHGEKDDFEVSEDLYKSCVAVKGCLTRTKLDELLKRYRNWNCIEWRIPVTQDGLYSQGIALERGFVVVGYDPGAFSSDEMVDGVLVCAFPNGVNFNQFNEIELTDKNRPLAEKVMQELETQRA